WPTSGCCSCWRRWCSSSTASRCSAAGWRLDEPDDGDRGAAGGTALPLPLRRAAQAGVVRMTAHGWTLLAVYLAVLIGGAWPLGLFIADVLEGRPTLLSRPLGWLERLCYRAAGVDPSHEMKWPAYALATVAFNVVGLLVVYLLQRLQAWLPLNPQHLKAV